MRTFSKKVRRDYSPLIYNLRIDREEGSSPVIQRFDPDINEYIPDRNKIDSNGKRNPTILIPTLTISSVDNTVPIQDALKDGSKVLDGKWYINGKPINEVWKSSEYSVQTINNTTQGKLSIYLNIDTETQYSIQYKVSLIDTRLKQTIRNIQSNIIVLDTFSLGKDGYTMSLGTADARRYNPFYDKLSIYEYKVSKGLIPNNEEEKEKLIGINSYIAKFPIYVYKASEKIEDGYTIKLFNSNEVEIIIDNNGNPSEGFEEILEINNSQIKIDLRLIQKRSYHIVAYIDGLEIARKYITVYREPSKYDIQYLNDSDISTSTKIYKNEVIVTSNGHLIECPESIVSMVWYTSDINNKEIVHNEGVNTIINLSKITIGDNIDNSSFDLYIKSEVKGNHFIIKDNSDILTDENNNILIFN